VSLESCGVVRENNIKALTEAGAGPVFSHEPFTLRTADAFRVGGRHNQNRRYREALLSSAQSQTPSTHRSTLHGNREVLRSPIAKNGLGRIGKSKDVRR
jgi:hypothetical protein